MRFSRKFQIGDKVKVIKPNDFRYKQIGKIIYYSYSHSGKGIYSVIFENSTSNYYSNNLEKVEDSSNTDIKSNKLSISDLKSGMKVRIKPDLKEGKSTVVYVTNDMKNFAGTINIIKNINLNTISYQYQCIYLENIPYTWDIDCFSEIIEESKEETGIITKVAFTLNEFKSEKLEYSKFTIL